MGFPRSYSVKLEPSTDITDVPERLNAIFCGSDKEWKLLHPCDVNQSSVVVDHTEMNSSSANTWLLRRENNEGYQYSFTALIVAWCAVFGVYAGQTHHIIIESSPDFSFLIHAVSWTNISAVGDKEWVATHNTIYLKPAIDCNSFRP